MNDLSDKLQGHLLLFVDDVKIIFGRANFDNLRRDLQNALDWALTRDLPLNENECGNIVIGSTPTRPYGASIRLLDTTKDFGMSIDSTFKPSVHCPRSSENNRTPFFLIRRSFVTLIPDIFIPL